MPNDNAYEIEVSGLPADAETRMPNDSKLFLAYTMMYQFITVCNEK